eukprot:TRINITY_DN4024_c0_g1_i10.p1 TRINITY_DN4024_c0_g1~~TRINITY_DN4024_c0_g1_i10.p1  ORF type:complete len:701 (-),score=258.59 TRINITY_DN4024_c0_g1_i10:2875-4977(-)
MDQNPSNSLKNQEGNSSHPSVINGAPNQAFFPVNPNSSNATQNPVQNSPKMNENSGAKRSGAAISTGGRSAATAIVASAKRVKKEGEYSSNNQSSSSHSNGVGINGIGLNNISNNHMMGPPPINISYPNNNNNNMHNNLLNNPNYNNNNVQGNQNIPQSIYTPAYHVMNHNNSNNNNNVMGGFPNNPLASPFLTSMASIPSHLLQSFNSPISNYYSSMENPNNNNRPVLQQPTLNNNVLTLLNNATQRFNNAVVTSEAMMKNGVKDDPNESALVKYYKEQNQIANIQRRNYDVRETALALTKQIAFDLDSLVEHVHNNQPGLVNPSGLMTAKSFVEGFHSTLSAVQRSFRVSPQANQVLTMSGNSLSLPNYIQIQQEEEFERLLQLSTLSDFEMIGIMSYGSFGTVVRCRHIPTGRYLCVKQLDQATLYKRNQTIHVISERNILRAVNHPFIVKLYNSFKDENSLYLLMELVQGGELFNYIRRGMPPSACRTYAAEVTLALEYLHARNIIYRDLKPENIVVDRQGHLKLIDFGFAKYIPHGRTQSMLGTHDYMAPEIWRGQGYGVPADWWSLGILIYEMLVGVPPFDFPQNCSADKTLEIIYNTQPDFSLGIVDPNAQDLINRLLHTNPAHRLGSMGSWQIRSHPWFDGVDWVGLESRSVEGPINPGITEEGQHKFIKGAPPIMMQSDLDVDLNEVFKDF